MQKRPLPGDWKTSDLLLLIGGNRLPNYVAAKLLLQEGGTAHLLHSASTDDTAQTLKQVLEKEGLQANLYEIKDPAQASKIRSCVRDALDNCKGATIGLNYTGGTKAMAVHAYEECMAAKGITVLPSYLDAQSRRLYRPDIGKEWSVQFLVCPTFETVIALQEQPLQQDEVQDKVKASELNRAIASAFTTVEKAQIYNKWLKDKLRPIAKLIHEEQHDNRTILHLPDQPEMTAVAAALRDFFDVSVDKVEAAQIIQALRDHAFSDLPAFVKHLDSDWIEHLALGAFQELKDECTLHDTAMTLNTKAKSPNAEVEDEETATHDFELDVAALQGYRLFAVSCTRSYSKKVCKSKLFEAYVRARQLGGDEARIGLVCAYPDPQALQREAESTWQAGNGQIRVFGAQDLAHLSDRFYAWMNS